MFRAVVLVLSCLLQRTLLTTEGHRGTNPHVFYAVQMDGGVGAARGLAKQHRLDFIHQIGSLDGLYTLRDSRGRSDRATFENELAATAGVKWVQRQSTHYREKRIPVTGRGHSTAHSSRKSESETDRRPEENKSDQILTFNDPLWPMQWELFAQGRYNSTGLDLNVMPVWRNNITGNGVVVSIIDDGIDHTNKDLKKNFEALASFDLCASHGLSHDPMPVRDEQNSHGTRCAGEVAMEANNSYCGVGIAFNARIGGIRLLFGPVTDAMEATSLTFNSHFIDIYVCSWGPRDDGAEMDGPHGLTRKALWHGTHKGRGGKGSIFVWASGNGGWLDHCGADGYVNSIFTIAIGAVSQTGKTTFFSEPCAGVMAVTLTGASAGTSQPLVTVTNTGDGCVTRFPGTSSAAPIAAGILALVLEVNPALTWRDVQHLIAKTAKIPDPKEPGWNINAEGYHVHHRFGFGLLDAGLMVQQAVHFNSVAPQRRCTQEVSLCPSRILSPNGVVTVNIQSKACQGSADEINTLEHVQVRVSISSVCRGDLSISLQSPAGTVSLLLDTRPYDSSSAGLKNWRLMTVHCWGENPQGLWTLKVADHNGKAWVCKRSKDEKTTGAVLKVRLILYGTYNPHRSVHEGPLQSIQSMGSRHPVPHRGVFHSHPPLDLIQWIYKMERDRKVQAADITVPGRHEKSRTPGNLEPHKKPLSSMALPIFQADVGQKSLTKSKPFPRKKAHETEPLRDNVDGERRSLPSQPLHRLVVDVEDVQQSDSPHP